MPMVYACIAPHAGDLIPETVRDQKIVATTRESMYKLGATLEALAPDVIVMINPHGFRVHGALSVSVAERAVADWAPDVKLNFEMDAALAHTIADKAAEANVPIARYIYGASSGPECFIPLDWGAVVPLYFMGHRFILKPKLVHLSPMRTLLFVTHYEFGRAVGRVIKESALRIAVIASADQGHAHAATGPYGYDPASARYDAWMQDLIRKGNLDELLNADPQ